MFQCLLFFNRISETHIITLQRAWYELDPNCSRLLSTSMVNKILLWADNADSSSVSRNNFVKSILNDRFIWPRYQVVLLTDLYAQMAVVITLSPFVTMTPAYSHLILSLALCWFVLREVADFFASSLQSYSMSYDNFFDLLQISLIFAIIFLKDGHEEEEYYSNRVLICLSLVAWLQLLLIIGQLSFKVSVFTYALFQVRNYFCVCLTLYLIAYM